MRKMLLALALCASLFGCASLQSFRLADNDPRAVAVARITIQYATLKYIDEDAEKAARVVAVVDQIIAAAEAEPVTLVNLKLFVDRFVPEDVDAADRLLIANLVNLVNAELSTRLPDGTVELGDLKTVLGWVKEAAAVDAPFPAPSA